MVDYHPEEWKILCARAVQEQDPEKLIKLITRINNLLEQKQARLLGRNLAGADHRGNHIFQIAYDEILLVTRAELLESRGYRVTSVLGNDDAKRLLLKGGSYRVFIVGHAAPLDQRQEIVGWIKANFPAAKILAINPPGINDVPGADLNFILNGPEGWLAAISSTLPPAEQFKRA